MSLKKNLCLIKTGNDLTFHFDMDEYVNVVLKDMPEEIKASELEYKKLPFWIIDPGSELLYTVVRFEKFT